MELQDWYVIALIYNFREVSLGFQTYITLLFIYLLR